MSRRQKDPLGPLSEAERIMFSQLSRSQSAPAAQAARARALLAVAEGQSYTRAAQLVGRACGSNTGLQAVYCHGKGSRSRVNTAHVVVQIRRMVPTVAGWTA